MNKRKVLELLKPKTKMLGFSRKELAKVADVIIAALPEEIDEADEESSINQKIDEYLPLLQFSQAASDRRINSLNNRRSASDFDDEPEDDADDELDDEPTTKQRKNRKHRHRIADIVSCAGPVFRPHCPAHCHRVRGRVEVLVRS